MDAVEHVSVLSRYEDFFMKEYDNFPHGRYVNLVLLRKTESETIFRTEGSGEGLSKEIVMAGLSANHQKPMRRVVISKRKQTAVERRVGRELLREYQMLKMGKAKNGEQVCSLNTNAPCGMCIDCILYGYAVGGGGAQKSRVMTDDAYSLGPVAQVTAKRTFNATFDNGTMRNPFDNKPSTSINEDEYVLPETHFLDIETLKDITRGEFQYVLGNVLRSSRYGAISSRLGRVQNTLVAIVFSNTEIFSNLELTQYVYDTLRQKQQETRPELPELSFPLATSHVQQSARDAIDALRKRVVGRVMVLAEDEQRSIEEETIALYQDEERVRVLLQQIERGYDKIRK